MPHKYLHSSTALQLASAIKPYDSWVISVFSASGYPRKYGESLPLKYKKATTQKAVAFLYKIVRALQAQIKSLGSWRHFYAHSCGAFLTGLYLKGYLVAFFQREAT
jgi:hypothetical protein